MVANMPPAWGNTKRIGSVEAGLLLGVLKTVTDAPRFQLWLMRELFGKNIGTARDITAEQWTAFEAEAYVDVAKHDMRLKPEFRVKLGELADTFRQSVQGQMTLPGF